MEKRTLHAIWAVVAMVLIITAAAVTLVLSGADYTVVTIIMSALAVPALGIFGAVIYQKLQQVQTTSNGNLAAEREQNRKNQDELLKMFRELHPGLKSPTE